MRLWVLGLFVSLLTQASPVENLARATCSNKSVRKSWHALTQEEKLAYIEAEKCLMAKPAKLGLKGARTRFDELQLSHVLQTNQVHGVGAFLGYHRLFVHAHEYLLQTECDYKGGHPYWDEALDAGNFSTSIILDPVSGFGGNGVGPSNCINDGPFKDYVNAIGPGEAYTDHCIDRVISDCSSQAADKKYVDECMKAQNFSTFWPCIEGAPHSAGHGGIGGQMINLWSSPGDPIFYLHHTYLDKLWWNWQTQNLSARLLDVTGRNSGSPFGAFPPGGFNGTFPPGFNGTFPGFNGSFPFPGGPGNGSCTGFGFPGGSPGGFPGGPPAASGAEENEEQFVKRDGDPGNITTLNHVLTVYGIVPNATIGDVMDIQGGLLCYEYE